MSILEVNHLKKIYTTRFSGNQVQALSNLSFSVEEGEYVAIMGESGSGKTTLLNILAALDKPTGGEVLLNGKNIVEINFSYHSLTPPKTGIFSEDIIKFSSVPFNFVSVTSIMPSIANKRDSICAIRTTRASLSCHSFLRPSKYPFMAFSICDLKAEKLYHM